MAEHVPDWRRLPGDPVGFFELDESFDRKQLRRSYSQLIRQFKPETHPQEFQRIREAYELLDGQLRYGRVADASPAPTNAVWSAAEVSAADVADPVAVAGKAAPEKPASRAPWEQLKETSPRTLYQELSKKEDRTPPEFYTLAVLSDLVDRKEPLMFFRWLLTGLSEHPEEPGLLRLLGEYFRTDLPDDAIGKALRATSKVVTGDRFYFLTEALWDRLLRKEPFEVFASTLAKCESNLRDHRIFGKLAFHIHILRAAAWKADSNWLEPRRAWLEEHASEIDVMLEQDLELTILICDYRANAADFVQGDRVRGLIDKVIRSYCLEDPREAAENIVQYQDRIARDVLGVMEAFPLGHHPSWESPLLVYRIVVAEIGDMVGLDMQGASPRQLEKQSLLLLKDLRGELTEIANRCMWSSRLIHGGTASALLVAPFILLYGFLDGFVMGLLTLFWTPGSLLLYAVVIRPLWTDKLVEKQYTSRFREAYRASWRPRLYRYCQSVASPIGLSLQAIIDTSRTVDDDWWVGWLFEFCTEDQGLEVFATAQPFLR